MRYAEAEEPHFDAAPKLHVDGCIVSVCTARPHAGDEAVPHAQILMRFGLGELLPEGQGFKFDNFYPHFPKFMAASVDAHARLVLAVIKHQGPRDEGATRSMRELLCGNAPQEVCSAP